MKFRRILITGGAGFIGFSLCKKLLEEKKFKVYTVDNLNNYYSVKIKKDRINFLKKNFKNFYFSKIDITNFKKLDNFVKKHKIEKIVHLAAQAGVRYSFTKPRVYFRSNLLGFFNILEVSRLNKISEILAASSSSVYGDQSKFPIKESYENSKPIQFYAATKKSNEIMAYSYYKMFKLNFVFMRFFTVYGPWGRPDMSLYKFTKNIINNKKIDVYNNGKHLRDFTYIDDIVSGIHKLVLKKNNGHKIFNIGNNKKVNLMNMIHMLERHLNKKAKINFLPMQPGDIYQTQSSTRKLENYVNYKSKTEINTGIKNFVDWFLNYYK
jgi:UDP-glucuronate 4-epimerase